MRLFIFAGSCAALFLGACGQSADAPSLAENTDQPARASDSSKTVTLAFNELDPETRSTMILGGCTVVYAATNNLKHEIKYLSFDYQPVPRDGDTNAASYVSARGDLRIYFGALKPGETRESYTTLEGLQCEAISGLKVKTKSCGLKSGETCNGQIALANNTAVGFQVDF